MAIQAGQPIVASDFVSTSSGAADSGKGIKLDSNGAIPASFQKAAFDTTEVFADATPPSSWTDLDLSSVVGAKQRMVMLRVKFSLKGTGPLTLGFRRNGETTEMESGSGGCTNVSLSNANRIAYVLVPTDSSGVVEWINFTNGPGDQAQVQVESYW